MLKIAVRTVPTTQASHYASPSRCKVAQAISLPQMALNIKIQPFPFYPGHFDDWVRVPAKLSPKLNGVRHIREIDESLGRKTGHVAISRQMAMKFFVSLLLIRKGWFDKAACCKNATRCRDLKHDSGIPRHKF